MPASFDGGISRVLTILTPLSHQRASSAVWFKGRRKILGALKCCPMSWAYAVRVIGTVITEEGEGGNLAIFCVACTYDRCE